MKIMFLLSVCGILLGLTGCALQDDIMILEERLMTLERKNEDLQRQNKDLRKKSQQQLQALGKSSQTTEKNLRTKYAGMTANIDALQQDVRLLNGRIEEIEFQIKRQLDEFQSTNVKQAERLDESAIVLAKIEQRINQLEQYLNFERKQAQSTATDKPAVNDQQLTADQIYTAAKQAYDKGNLEKARQGFLKLIHQHPKSERVDNAQFWIGESYYREKWYEKAILEYQAVIEKYPKGNKVPAAMLKQGMAFFRLGDKSNARLILKELVKKHPQTNEGKIAIQKLKEF